MRPESVWFGLALCLCASSAASAQDDPEDDDVILELIREDGTLSETGLEPSAEFLRCNKAPWRMPGQYLVILRAGSHESHVQRSIRRLRAKAGRRGYLVDVLQTYSGAMHGFLVKMNSDVLHLAVKLPHVHYIEEDSSIFAQNAPWNLQKILQPYGGPSENGTYKPPNDGGLAQVFLMDGSVHSSHREVEGRVLVTDFNHVPEEDGVRVHRQASQCDSHGTHMAGVLSGADSGVARGAGVNLVRVLNCQGKGTVSGALAGLEYIRASLIARPLDAVVVLLPFVGGFSRSLNAACKEMASSGVVVIAAAGNFREDACLYSPASEPEVITVGAVNSADQLMSQGAGGTNFGRCVDLFAPGDDIVSASSDCSTCFTPRSGTSQAAAHAAGIAAVILSANQKSSPVQLLHTMLHYSIRNAINLLSVPEPQRPATPNLVTAIPPVSADIGGELLCRSVWSERSGVRAVSRCRHGEKMMGCSSYAPDGGRVGETVDDSSGRMECVADAGPAGQGVYAVARCCVIADLQCHVHSSPRPGQDVECERPQSHLTVLLKEKNTLATLRATTRGQFRSSDLEPNGSNIMPDDLSDPPCPEPSLNLRQCSCQKVLQGEHHENRTLPCCTSWSAGHLSSGSRPHHGDRRLCLVPEGVVSSALCCHAPALECQALERTAAEQVEVPCPAGWTLTDCSAVSHGSILGAVARGNSCHVHSSSGGGGGSSGSDGAVGIAVCCHIREDGRPAPL